MTTSPLWIRIHWRRHLQELQTSVTQILSISGIRFVFFLHSSSVPVDCLPIILLHVVIIFMKYRKAPEGSTRKTEAQKQVLEAMSHRLHVDNSVKLVGKLLFGISEGPQVLNKVRPSGEPLVDDWNCLKNLVNNCFLCPLRLFICQSYHQIFHITATRFRESLYTYGDSIGKRINMVVIISIMMWDRKVS